MPSSFATRNRFSLAGFIFAAAMTVLLNGTMLMGFDQIAASANPCQPQCARLAKTAPALPSVKLERVVVTTRRA